MAILDSIEIVLQNAFAKTHSIYLNVFDTSLSRKWYNALQEILEENLHLEKNYLWHGWADSKRNGEYLCEQINKTICYFYKFVARVIINDCYCLS